MSAIILDLDDTIFQTKSMDTKVFVPFFTHFSANLRNHFNPLTIDSIATDLWQIPFDAVIKKYGIPLEIIMPSIAILEKLSFNLKISPFPDYDFIKSIALPKFLVTTGVTALQRAKIRALRIENDFMKIVINDTFKEPKTKQDIFNELISEFKLIPEKTYVVGDNSDSEIKAGNCLNMATVQILRDNVIKGNNARYYIKSFTELEKIMI